MHVSYSVSYFLFKVFIGFVLKQFEYIEVGQFRQVSIPFGNEMYHFNDVSKDFSMFICSHYAPTMNIYGPLTEIQKQSFPTSFSSWCSCHMSVTTPSKLSVSQRSFSFVMALWQVAGKLLHMVRGQLVVPI